MSIGSHWRYFTYVIRHKWFVLLAGLKLRVPIWQLVTHDWSKFLPSEWIPYVRYFYSPKAKKVDGQYFHKPGDDRDFDYAWLLHQQRQPHHWQHWILRRDDGTIEALPMKGRYVREMVADWIGAGRAQAKGEWNPREVARWYRRNKNRMVLHPVTRRMVEYTIATYLTTLKSK